MVKIENLRGRGEIERWDCPNGRHDINYDFIIITETIERPGFPRPESMRHISGDVFSFAGELFSEGEYRLHAKEGILKVKNLGYEWTIVE
jgi:hypothetical protein